MIEKLAIAAGGYYVYSRFVKFKNQDKYRKLIYQVKSQYDFLEYIPTNLVLAIIQVESNFRENVTGAQGEYGLMQIHPVTFRWIFTRYLLGIPVDPYDPFINILAGMLVLDAYYSSLGSWFSTIHAYNIGVGAYSKGQRNYPYFNKVLEGWFV